MAFDKKIYGGILLVTGTAIGAGMLSLPLRLGIGGLLGSTMMMLFGFSYMLTTLFLLLEILFYQEESLTLIGLARRYLGKIGELAAWVCFLGLLYIASSAYTIGGVDLILPQLNSIAQLSQNTWSILFVCTLGLISFYGVRWIDWINRPLMIGLVVSFIALLVLITPHLQIHDNLFGKPQYLAGSAPLVILAFTSHIVLPSLKPYLNNHIPSLKKVMITGSILPLTFYLVWIYLIVLLLPFDGPGSIVEIAKHRGGELSHLRSILANNYNVFGLDSFYSSFSFFAIITSFLGVILSLADFLKDGLNLHRLKYGSVINLFLTFVPPLLIVLYNPGFTAVLNYGGVLIAILFSLIPVSIAWKVRYIEGRSGPYQLPGGKPVLVLIALIAIIIIALQILSVQNLLPAL